MKRATTPGGMAAALQSNLTTPDAQTLQTSEPLFLAGMELGRIHWNDPAQKVTFESVHPALRDLELIAWSCPAAARLYIHGYALEAGLGNSLATDIEGTPA